MNFEVIKEFYGTPKDPYSEIRVKITFDDYKSVQLTLRKTLHQEELETPELLDCIKKELRCQMMKEIESYLFQDKNWDS